MTPEDLESRLRWLEDRAAISELVFRYTLAVDGWDPDARLDLFTTDARIEHDDHWVIEGADAMRQWAARLRPEDNITVHSTHGHLIEFVDEDHATGIVAAHSERCVPTGPLITALRYYDKYRREGGRWLFEERRLRFWYSMSPSELGEFLCNPLRVRGWLHQVGTSYVTHSEDPRRPSLPYELESYRHHWPSDDGTPGLPAVVPLP